MEGGGALVRDPTSLLPPSRPRPPGPSAADHRGVPARGLRDVPHERAGAAGGRPAARGQREGHHRGLPSTLH